jgi:hypothetical protein
MTPQELVQHGYRRFEWNGGLMIEYWKPLSDDNDFDFRLGVRFGERRDVPFIVWFTTKYSMYAVKRTKTIEQLETLFGLLRY